MIYTSLQNWIIIGVITIGTMITRFLPFVLFPEGRKTPRFITFLSEALPAAMMGLLVVYSLKDIKLSVNPYGLPEIIAIVITVIIHKIKASPLLSIMAGTLSYMILIRIL